jgi:hypothetical protein
MSLSQAVPMACLVFFVMMTAGAIIVALYLGWIAIFYSAVFRYVSHFWRRVDDELDEFHDDLHSR